jgi:hypothetical protein
MRATCVKSMRTLASIAFLRVSRPVIVALLVDATFAATSTDAGPILRIAHAGDDAKNGNILRKHVCMLGPQASEV